MKAVRDLSEKCVAVVVPAFRAAVHIAAVLEGIPDFVTWIVVVDDGSPDATGATVEAAARRDPRIRLLRHARNQGVGGATLTGYREAHRLGADIIVKMDSDGQMDPRWLPSLVAPILRGEADYTKGNRYLHARELHAMPWLRRIGNVGLSFLTKLASGYWGLFDPTNGYTAIHASLVPLLDRGRIAPRYFFESSLLLELSLLRAVVRDVYIPARYGEETSHLSEVESLCRFPAALFQGMLRRLWVQYFVRDFSIASLYLVAALFLLAAGTGFGAVHWCLSVRVWHARHHGYRDAGRPAGDPGLSALASRRGAGYSRPARPMPAPRPGRRAGPRGGRNAGDGNRAMGRKREAGHLSAVGVPASAGISA